MLHKTLFIASVFSLLVLMCFVIVVQKIATTRAAHSPGSAPKPRAAPKPKLQRIKKKREESEEEDASLSFSEEEDDDLFGDKEDGGDGAYKPSSSGTGVTARSTRGAPSGRPAKTSKQAHGTPVRATSVSSGSLSSGTDSESDAHMTSPSYTHNPLASDPHHRAQQHQQPHAQQSPVKKVPSGTSPDPFSSSSASQPKKPGPPKQTGSVKQRLAKKLGVKMQKK